MKREKRQVPAGGAVKVGAKPKNTKSAKPVQKPHEEKQDKKTLKIRFLGGVGEIGKNMTAIEYGKDIIIIDAGLTFPSEYAWRRPCDTRRFVPCAK